MMRKNQNLEKISKSEKKGITLIALVITIIVMLILVGVTISMALNGGLFGYAKKAAKETSEKINEESSFDWDSLIKQYLDGEKKSTTYTISNNVITDSNGKKYNVGDKIDSISTDDLEWRAIGVENGKILLVSVQNVTKNFSLGSSDIDNWDGQTQSDAETKLNEECIDRILHGEPFQEIGITNVRSITVDDINKLTGYTLASTTNPDIKTSDVELGYNTDKGSAVKLNSITIAGSNNSSQSLSQSRSQSQSASNFYESQSISISMSESQSRAESETTETTGDYCTYPFTDYLETNSEIYKLLADCDDYWLANPYQKKVGTSLVEKGLLTVKKADAAGVYPVKLYEKNTSGVVSVPSSALGVKAVIYINCEL